MPVHTQSISPILIKVPNWVCPGFTIDFSSAGTAGYQIQVSIKNDQGSVVGYISREDLRKVSEFFAP